MMATRNNREGLCKLLQRDNRLKCTFAPDPYVWRVLDSLPLEFERPSVVHVRPGIFRIRQELMHGTTRSGSAQIGENTACIQPQCNFSFRPTISGEAIVDFLDGRDLIFRAGHQDDAVSLNALLFAG